jgi:hypothetical protein
MNMICNFLYSILAGIIASLIVLLWEYNRKEIPFKRKFNYLEGKYNHIVDGVKKNDCETIIKYFRGGVLNVETSTSSRKWKATILMNKDMGNYGAGSFSYICEDESGFMQLLIKDEKNIHVFPMTLTYPIQKTDFYILQRKN